MGQPDAAQRFNELDDKQDIASYNYEHFRTKHVITEAKRMITNRGIRPGELAPDFALPGVAGGTLRLSDFRGQLVLLHFGSIS